MKQFFKSAFGIGSPVLLALAALGATACDNNPKQRSASDHAEKAADAAAEALKETGKSIRDETVGLGEQLKVQGQAAKEDLKEAGRQTKTAINDAVTTGTQ